jgi:hypothetical protein
MIGNTIYECKTRNNINAAHSDDVAQSDNSRADPNKEISAALPMQRPCSEIGTRRVEMMS